MFRLRRIYFSGISKRHDMKPLTFISFSVFFLWVSPIVSLPLFLSPLSPRCLSLNIYLLFSPYRPFVLLWCWFLQLSAHHSCHLSFIDASSKEHIRNATISAWLIVIALRCSLDVTRSRSPEGVQCVNRSIYTVHFHFVHINTPALNIILSYSVLVGLWTHLPAAIWNWWRYRAPEEDKSISIYNLHLN